MEFKEAIQIMTDEIAAILSDNPPTIYLYGSAVLDDFKRGWSDIDILVLTKRKICAGPAETLVGLRQTLSERYPNNPYFRLFEGGMQSVHAFLANRPERTVYWGTSGQRITDSYILDSFGMAQLLDNGVLLYGEDIRDRMEHPTYAQMRDDIAREIYTLRTGNIIAKTAAGEWALENNLCPDAEAMQKAIQCRKEAHLMQDKSIDNSIIQRFADVIDAEFVNTIERLHSLNCGA